MTISIQTHQLTKRFGKDTIINSVTMTIKEGEIYGFLGPNGAGKTTIMKMLLNLIKPTSGSIKIQNELISTTSYEYLKNVGSLIEYPIFYDDLTALENLQLHCAYNGFKNESQIKNVLDIVGLKKAEKKKIKEFSLGMRQRLAIARAIVTKPKILILDEPINGLDPVGIKEVRELLVMLKKQYGMTILISSHIVSEIEAIADTIGIVNNGKLLEEISVHSLHEKHISTIEIVVSDVKKAQQLLSNYFNAKVEIKNDTTLTIHTTDQKPSSITKYLILHDVDVDHVQTIHQSLEDYFINRISGGNKIA